MLNSFNLQNFIRTFYTKFPAFSAKLPLVYSDVLDEIQITSDSILVLSPNKYWIQRVTLNVRNEKEAASFGAALFDLNDEYRYEALEVEKNTFMIIAYHPNEVTAQSTTDTEISLIKHVTFAQWVFDEVTLPIRLPNHKFLTVIDGIVVEIDPSYIDPSSSIDLQTALSNPKPFFKTLPFEQAKSSEISVKTLLKTLMIVTLFFINFIAILLLNYQESTHLNEKITQLLSDSKLPETAIEREAILNSLISKEKKQFHIRHLYNQINELPISGKISSAKPVSSPSVPATSSDGIVLIPGSKPGEPNRLLVDSTSSVPTLNLQGEGIQDITYDGNVVSLVLDTQSATEKDVLKNKIMHNFKEAQINEENTTLEVRFK